MKENLIKLGLKTDTYKNYKTYNFKDDDDTRRHQLVRVIKDYGKQVILSNGINELTMAKPHDKLSQIQIGDWIIAREDTYNHNTLHYIDTMPRTSTLCRKVAGLKSDQQVIAVNIDTLFIVQSINDNLNLKRLERYLVAAWDSGATPVVLLTKSDLCNSPNNVKQLVINRLTGVDILTVSALSSSGIAELMPYLTANKTITFVGSSGTGKTTLTNLIASREVGKTCDIRLDDSKGRHTTTSKQLILGINDVLVIDTPGMREFGITSQTEGLKQVFFDIESLAKFCKFSDCKHHLEPDCAVKIAITNGDISKEHFDNWQKLIKEQQHAARREHIKHLRNQKKKKY